MRRVWVIVAAVVGVIFLCCLINGVVSLVRLSAAQPEFERALATSIALVLTPTARTIRTATPLSPEQELAATTTAVARQVFSNATATAQAEARAATPQPSTTATLPAGAIAASATVSAALTPVTGGLGAMIDGGGIAVGVSRVYRADNISGRRPPAGATFLLVDVTIQNTGRDEATYNYSYFTLRDSANAEYNTTFAPEPSLRFGRLLRGDRVAGLVAFQIPQTAAGFTAYYTTPVLTQGIRQVRINLGQ